MLDIDSLGFNVKVYNACLELNLNLNRQLSFFLTSARISFQSQATCQGTTVKLRVPFPRRAEDRK